MSDSRENDAAITLEEDGIRVEKFFSSDEFPVPAVVFDVTSSNGEPVRVRLTDVIPESFPMDRVGFHPDYRSENWTAYNDHRVEFEYALRPDEEVRTVFGIRADDPDVDAFLTVPTVDVVPEGEEIETVLGGDSSEVVREVLGGDRSSLPGMEEEDQDVDEGPAAPSQEAIAEAMGEVESEPTDQSEGTEEPVPDESLTAEIAASGPVGNDGVANESSPRTIREDTTPAITPHEPTEGTEESGSQGEKPSPSETETAAKTGGVAATLAAEIRAGEVSDDDLDLLQAELDVGTPRSVDTRISHLQSRVEDLAAYADALEEFIDDRGTAEDILGDLRSSIAAIETTIVDLESRAEDAADHRARLAADIEATTNGLDDVDMRISDVGERVGSVAERIDSVEESVEESIDASVEAFDDRIGEVHGRVGEAESHAESMEEELGDVWEDVAEMDSRIVSLERAVGEDAEDLNREIERIDEELEELGEFRDRLSDAFGT